MSDNGLKLVVAGGAFLVILGSILLNREGGVFLLGLVALLAGAALVVIGLLRLIEAGGGSAAVGSGRTPAGGAFINLEGLKHMSAASQWTAGILMGAIALLGLFLFSRAGDGMFALFAGLLFLFGLAMIVVLVHQATDYSSRIVDAGEVEYSPAEISLAEEHRPAA